MVLFILSTILLSNCYPASIALNLADKNGKKKKKIANAYPPFSLMEGLDEYTGRLECSVINGIMEEEQNAFKIHRRGSLPIKGRVNVESLVEANSQET